MRRPSRSAMLGDEGLHRPGIGSDALEAPRQLLDASERRWPFGLAAQRLDEGGRELDRQRGLEHEHGLARPAQAARDLQAVGGVRVQGDAVVLGGVADGGQPVSDIVWAMVEHTAHHRGALTVYSRLLEKFINPSLN